jgi:restriction endonuclease Mrr
MGYGGSRRDASAQLGRSGDGGVDGVINEDRLGLDRVYVQARRYGPGSVVGRPDVQGFVGSLVGLGASKGVFVTTSTFSAQAAELSRRFDRDGDHRIPFLSALWMMGLRDGKHAGYPELSDLLDRHGARGLGRCGGTLSAQA